MFQTSVVLFSAVTVYSTVFVKSFATPDTGSIVALSDIIMVGTRLLIFAVLFTSMATVCVLASGIPKFVCSINEKETISFSLL